MQERKAAIRMKCVCGYEHESKWDFRYGEEVAIKGDEMFLRIQDAVIDGDGKLEKRAMFACPKCGTVRTEVW